jgi:hypothetical protein
MIKDFFSRVKISPRVVPETEPLNHHISYDLPRGSCYLVKEPKAEFSFKIFTSLVKGRCQDCNHQEAFPCESIDCKRCALPCTCKGCRHVRAQGLCFTMRSPMEIRLKYALQITPIFWISNHGPENVSPVDLEIIANVINKFLKQSNNPVVLLDGIEHLIFENGSAPVLRFLRDAGEEMVLRNAILILPVNQLAIEEKEMALMERSMNSLNPDGK